MIMKPDFGKIFLAIFIIGLIARIFTLAVLPESALVDSLYNVSVAKDAALQQAVPLVGNVIISPLYYVFSASLHLLSGFPFEMPFVRIIPIFIAIVFFACAFLFFRKLFPKNYIVPLAFSSMFPWLVRYGAVNNIDVLSAAVLCFILCLFLEIKEQEKPAMKYAVLSAIAISGFILLKLNTIALWPVIFFAFVWLFALNKKNKANAMAFAVIVLALSFAWFAIASLQGYGISEKFYTGEVAGYVAEMGIAGIANSVFVSHLSFYDFPPEESFGYVPLLRGVPVAAVQGIFTVLVLPITIAILLGIWFFLRRGNAINIFMLLLLIAAIATMVVAGYTEKERLMGGLMYIRYLVPVMPLFAIAFAYGLDSIKGKWKAVALVSFALFAIYALAYAGISSLFYAGIYEKHAGLFEFAKALPESAKIHSMENGKALAFYSDMRSGEISGIYDLKAGEIYGKLREGGFTHIAVSCYRNPWDDERLSEMEAASLIERIYRDDCARVYEIK